MKKVTLWVLVALCLIMSAESVFAAYNAYSENKAIQADAEAFFRKADVLMKDVRRLANKIAKNNKPAFEAKLTKREIGSDILWNRVYAKDKTLVFAFAGKNKAFEGVYLVTSDPNFVFSGGIRVGASTKVLERFFSEYYEKHRRS